MLLRCNWNTPKKHMESIFVDEVLRNCWLFCVSSLITKLVNLFYKLWLLFSMPKKAQIRLFFKFWGNKFHKNIWINLIMCIHISENIFSPWRIAFKKTWDILHLSLLFHHRSFAFMSKLFFSNYDFY